MKYYQWLAVDRMTGKVVGRSNDYIAICKRFKSMRYTIKEVQS